MNQLVAYGEANLLQKAGFCKIFSLPSKNLRKHWVIRQINTGVLMKISKMRVVVAALLEPFPANAGEFGFLSTLKVQVTNQMGFLLVGVSAFLARVPPRFVHFVLADAHFRHRPNITVIP